MEQIVIEELEVYGHHGVYEQEKKDGQIFVVDCVMDVSFGEAAVTDELAHTVDYGNVCLFIKKFFTENAFDLLETVAESLSTDIMYAFPGIHKLWLKIRKPEAPIPMEFSSVGVVITKEWTRVAISFGSNIEPREQYLTEAMEKLLSNPAIRNLVVSDYIETEPYGFVEQDKFLNGAAVFETLLQPQELLEQLHIIENEAGRERTQRWGPRTLDLDIALYGDIQINTKDLIVPHLDMANRGFVLEPLCQIAPGMVHPIYDMTVYDMLQRLRGKMI